MEAAKGVSHDDLTPADLLDMKRRLNDDLQQLQEAKLTLNQESEAGDSEEISKRITKLQAQLTAEYASRYWCELRLKWIQMGKRHCEILFTDPKDETHQTSVENHLKKLELTPKIFKIEKETEGLQQKLDEQNKLNFRLKAENIELLRKLKDSKEKCMLAPEVTRNKEYRRLKEKFDVICESNKIHKNIIERLMVGLGVDFSKEEELQTLLEKCNEPLEF